MGELDEDKNLREKVERQAARMKQAEKDRPTLLAHTVYMGTLGLLFVVPVVIGAYLGLWLDKHFAGYSVQWTVTCILLGVFVGAVNVYLFIRDR
jgi:ATP synthase protein I